MDFGENCFQVLKEIDRGHTHYDTVLFTLDDLKMLPDALKEQKTNKVGDLMISPFLITNKGLMEAYWCSLSVKVVNSVKDKFDVFMKEAGISSLKEIEEAYVEQWDNTYYEIQKDDLPGLISSIKRYISYMEYREKDLISEVDRLSLKELRVYYEIK